MAEARSRDQWNHTASVLAMLANIHRDAKKSRPFKPADFHPHRKAVRPPITKVGIDVLKHVFVDRPSGV